MIQRIKSTNPVSDGRLRFSTFEPRRSDHFAPWNDRSGLLELRLQRGPPVADWNESNLHLLAITVLFRITKRHGTARKLPTDAQMSSHRRLVMKELSSFQTIRVS